MNGDTVQSVQVKLQEDLTRIEHWLAANKLTLNVKKTKSMTFCTPYFRGDTSLNLLMGGENIEQVSKFKYLGIWLEPRLTFNYHVESVCKKSKMRLGAIGRTKKYITKDICLSLYKSLVLPHLDYADIIYMHTSAENLAKLQLIQNNACRLILREGRMTSVLQMHLSLELNTLCDRRIFRVSIYMFKCMKGLILDKNIVKMFDVLALQHGANTRAQQRNDLIVRQTRTMFGDRAFSVFGARMWNMLSDE